MSVSTLLATGSTPVVDIDGTIFIQAGIFIALVFILNSVLFQPWLATYARRYEKIGGALAKAKQLRADADTLASEYEQKIVTARNEATELRSSTRRTEELKQAETLAGLRATANEELEAARQRHERDAETARTELAGRVEELAQEMTSKLLERAS